MAYISITGVEENKDLHVQWEVADGFAGKSRPQHCVVAWGDGVSDILEAFEARDIDEDEANAELDNLIELVVQDEFESRVSWFVKKVE